MLEQSDAKKIVETLGNNMIGVSHDAKNFQRLPDSYWGYFARGHDEKGAFGVIMTYSENPADVDDLIGMYRRWAEKHKGSQNTEP